MNQNIENIKMAIRSTINWNKPLDEVRKELESYAINAWCPDNVIITNRVINNSKVEEIIPDEAYSDELLIYVHGGGFCLGIVDVNRAFVCKISKELGIKTMLLDYRLAPEYPYPNGLNDFVNLYIGLLDEGSVPKKINIVADSSGCGLALSGMQLLKTKNIELPKALVMMSPVVDFAKTGESFITKQMDDPYHIQKEYFIDNNYIIDLDPTEPTISPIYGSFEDFPPMIIHASESDVFLSDSQNLNFKLVKEGVEVIYREWEGLWHNFHMSYQILPEAQMALEEIYAFLKNI